MSVLINGAAGSTSAVIYTRVSSTAQTKRGDGLRSQETRCREFARMKGYTVHEVFQDDLSGSLINRPGMQAVLAWLRKHRHEKPVVIIDDVSRLARDLNAHLRLRSAISEAGGRLESPTIEFGEDSDSILVENMLASVSQHQRQKNAEQTRNRMRARISKGYWCFQAPVGYRYESKPGHGKVLVRHEPHASIVQAALTGFASGRFTTQTEVKRFLESQAAFPKDLPDGQIRQQRVVELLTRPIYAGMVEAPSWGVPLQRGNHEGLIDLDTFDRVQQRLKATAYAPRRKDLHQDFPLRGAVLCGCCRSPLTACWSKGKNRHYAYYLCQSRSCTERGKSVPKGRLEEAFSRLLDAVTPTGTFSRLAASMFRDVWDQRLQNTVNDQKSFRAEIQSARKKIDGLLEKLMDCSSPSVVRAYEQRIAEIEKSVLIYEDRLAAIGKPLTTFEQMFEHAMTFLSNPIKLWDSGNLEAQRAVLRLTFPRGIEYSRESGFRTPELASPFKILHEISGPSGRMAHLEGERLNILFQELADWNHQLKHLNSSDEG